MDQLMDDLLAALAAVETAFAALEDPLAQARTRGTSQARQASLALCRRFGSQQAALRSLAIAMRELAHDATFALAAPEPSEKVL